MLTSRLVSPLIAVLHTFISSNWRVVSFPLSQKSHGSTCFRPDLPGSSFQTPAILSVGGGGPSCRDPKKTRGTKPTSSPWRMQPTAATGKRRSTQSHWRWFRALWKPIPSKGGGFSERWLQMKKQSSEAQLPFSRRGRCCWKPHNAEAWQLFQKLAKDKDEQVRMLAGRVSSMANTVGNTQCRSMAAFQGASQRWS